MNASPHIVFANSASEDHIRTATYGPARFDFNRLRVDNEEVIKRLCRERVALAEALPDDADLATMAGQPVCKVGDWREWFGTRLDG